MNTVNNKGIYTIDEVWDKVYEHCQAIYPELYNRPDCPMTRERCDPGEWVRGFLIDKFIKELGKYVFLDYMRMSKDDEEKYEKIKSEYLFSREEIHLAACEVIDEYRRTHDLEFDIYDANYWAKIIIRDAKIGEKVISDEEIEELIIGYFDMIPNQKGQVIQLSELERITTVLIEEGKEIIDSFVKRKKQVGVVMISTGGVQKVIITGVTKKTANALCNHLNSINNNDINMYFVKENSFLKNVDFAF